MRLKLRQYRVGGMEDGEGKRAFEYYLDMALGSSSDSCY
jgi:hypothetical protein